MNEVPTVVVGYDGSDPARRSLERVMRLAGPGARVVVIAVHGSAVGDAELGPDASGAERLLAEAREVLEAAPGLVIETRVSAGDPATVLVDAARELAAELLVVGRRGDDFVARALRGSVVQQVIQQAPCDVLAVR